MIYLLDPGPRTNRYQSISFHGICTDFLLSYLPGLRPSNAFLLHPSVLPKRQTFSYSRTSIVLRMSAILAASSSVILHLSRVTMFSFWCAIWLAFGITAVPRRTFHASTTCAGVHPRAFATSTMAWLVNTGGARFPSLPACTPRLCTGFVLPSGA